MLLIIYVMTGTTEAKFKEFCESKGENSNEIKISDVYKLVSGQI